MSAIFDHHPWTVQELVNDVTNGRVRLPDLQRPFVWSNTKVRDLMDSMYKGYPVGELMFWENSAADHTKTIGTPGKVQEASFQIVDGQQRLTSLYAVVQGYEVWREGYAREAIKIAFNPRTQRFEVPGIATRGPEWIPDIVEVFRGDQWRTVKDYVQRLKDAGHEIDDEAESQIAGSLSKLQQLINYKFEVIQLKQDITREEVADIFVRINSEGMNLTAADFILTWLSVFWEDGRGELEGFARDSRFTVSTLNQLLGRKVSWSPHNPYLAVTPGQMLRVSVGYGLRRGRLSDAYNSLRGRDPRTREIVPADRERELSRLKAGQEHVLKENHWDEFLKVLERAGFRSSSMISSANTVLYTYILWLTGRVDYKVPVDRLREVVARYFFMAQITGRYTNSPETRIQEDISRIDSIPEKTAESFIAELDGMISAAVPEDWWRVTLVDNLITSSTTAPAYLAYVASLNILQAEVLLANTYVRDWIDPSRVTVKGIERHHLFPKDYLKTVKGISSTKLINQVANFALVEWSDNIEISNEAPQDYWPVQVHKKNMDAARVARQLQWHALPDGWIDLAYEDFLALRRGLMAKVVHEGFKFLSDPNYQPNLERGSQTQDDIVTTLPTLEELVVNSVVEAGTALHLASDEQHVRAVILSDGSLEIGERVFATPAQAAREFGFENGNLWAVWLIEDDPAGRSLSDIRSAK
jgi:hypothetical protein